MPLAPGTHLGPYEIVAPLGAGGMGEVYRARDTRLARDVAIKILPAQFSADPIRKQRFEREAKTISSLNHPHICTLFDVGQQGGMDYLVMECVEGDTLATRLEKGPLPLDQVLKYGAQIADALDKAHRSGIVHRDLKPANIILTSTGAKLLDFGLAKPALPLATAATLTAASPSPVTEQGTIMGTFQYMSPEQLQGNEVDARSDIFSFGAVLYEMVTGKRAFAGKSQLSVATAILEKDPALISDVKPTTPASLDHTIRRCLAKDREERWQTARDLALELKWSAANGAQNNTVANAPLRRKGLALAGWLIAAALSLLLIGGSAAWWQVSKRHSPSMYFHTSVPFPANDLALSLDGRVLAMVAYSEEASNYVLWTYEVGGRRTNSLGGTQGASYPFWSPDGKSVGFFAEGKLKKVEVSTGQVQVVCDAPNGRGGAWNRDGVIVFSPDGLNVGLFRVPAWGGSPVEMTKPDASRYESSHRWPVFLPDGKHFLYLGANFSGHLENNAIFLGSLDSQERRLLVSTSANAAYAEPGYLLYLRDNKALVAQPFDLQRYVLSGEPHTLTDEVLNLTLVDRAVFSVSGKDILVVQTGKGASLSQLTWFDRSGKPQGTVGKSGTYSNVRLSPDGRRVASDQTDPDGRRIDIWIHELAQGSATRLTFDSGTDQQPIWSPDGKQILFSGNLRTGNQLYLKSADGSGPNQALADLGTGVFNPWDWSREGKYILFGKGTELWYLSTQDRTVKPLSQAKWSVRNAQFSPDGRWMAYASNETGSMEIYVSSFPSGNGKWQASSGGGQEPRWRQDGKELFYVSADGKMMAVAVTTGSSFKAGSPVALFQTHRRQPVSFLDVFSYDVSADGQKFLVATKINEPNSAPLSVLLNWASEMEK